MINVRFFIGINQADQAYCPIGICIFPSKPNTTFLTWKYLLGFRKTVAHSILGLNNQFHRCPKSLLS
ncbi:hypothetical protein AVDCRST_MAG84-5042 [uncultured Microcoleus sp.]|uniref:Uncharacterized protein n=1 Tax=uncultured Microcoleus sp. TaxID=259945 RepID=A0A6J4NAM3_9CYAN|nr:hypothetical protein AVDCRST_MAG84-5042 [uncultured Microcoleus sp.]